MTANREKASRLYTKLERAGLSELYATMVEGGIADDVIEDLQEHHLAALGISVGDQIRVIRALAREHEARASISSCAEEATPGAPRNDENQEEPEAASVEGFDNAEGQHPDVLASTRALSNELSQQIAFLTERVEYVSEFGTDEDKAALLRRRSMFHRELRLLTESAALPLHERTSVLAKRINHHKANKTERRIVRGLEAIHAALIAEPTAVPRTGPPRRDSIQRRTTGSGLPEQPAQRGGQQQSSANNGSLAADTKTQAGPRPRASETADALPKATGQSRFWTRDIRDFGTLGNLVYFLLFGVGITILLVRVLRALVHIMR